MVNLVAHGIIVDEGKVLLIRRSKIKRGKINFNADRWDVPGGTVEKEENPRETVIRETKEEVNCIVKTGRILYDKFEHDNQKGEDFLTLIYLSDLIDKSNILLDPEEHSEYRWLNIEDILKNNVDLDILDYVRPR